MLSLYKTDSYNNSIIFYIVLLQLEFAEERHAMLKSNSEAFKKEASAASEKSRNLQVAISKIQATLDSVSQVSKICHVRNCAD